MNPKPIFITAHQISEMLGVTEYSVWRWARTMTGPPSIKTESGRVRFPYDEFLTWLESRRVRKPSTPKPRVPKQ